MSNATRRYFDLSLVAIFKYQFPFIRRCGLLSIRMKHKRRRASKPKLHAHKKKKKDKKKKAYEENDEQAIRKELQLKRTFES